MEANSQKYVFLLEIASLLQEKLGELEKSLEEMLEAKVEEHKASLNDQFNEKMKVNQGGRTQGQPSRPVQREDEGKPRGTNILFPCAAFVFVILYSTLCVCIVH